MKFISLVVLVIVFTACSPSSKNESAAVDSLALIDSVVITEEVFDAAEDSDFLQADSSQIDQLLSDRKKAHEMADGFFEVSMETNQYEATSHVTWHFDVTYTPRYFMQTWVAEGNEGFTEFFIDDGKVVCADEEDGLQSIKWCEATGGIRTENESSEYEPSGVYKLPDTYAPACNERLANFLNTLKQILKEGTITNPDEERYIIKNERPFEEGVEFTETVEVSIGKKLYQELMK